MKPRIALPFVLALGLSACTAAPFFPSPRGVSDPSDSVTIVGHLAVAFLNRFSASTVSPEQCLIDFTDSCSGKAEELSDIQNNRRLYEILGARLGAPAVSINQAGTGASIAMACSWDSRAITCETSDCVVGAIGSVGGTCTMTAVREAAGWKLCTSHFSGRNITPSTRLFFGSGEPQ